MVKGKSNQVRQDQMWLKIHVVSLPHVGHPSRLYCDHLKLPLLQPQPPLLC